MLQIFRRLQKLKPTLGSRTPFGLPNEKVSRYFLNQTILLTGQLGHGLGYPVNSANRRRCDQQGK